MRIPGDAVRRVLAVSAVVALASVSGCGDSGSSDGSTKSAEPSPSASAEASPSSSTSADASGSGKPGAAADGRCGGGAFATKVVEAAQGVQLTVPAAWNVKSTRQGAAVGLYPPNPEAGDGYLVVQAEDQTLDEAVDEVLKSTTASAQKTSERDLDLEGFDAARLVTFAYDDSEKTYAVDVVAVLKGQRVAVDMTREPASGEQAVVESCLSTLKRTP